LSLEDEMENTVCCMERQSDECSNKEENNTKDIVAVAHSLEWKLGDHLVRMD
jgi:hypothetical protein